MRDNLSAVDTRTTEEGVAEDVVGIWRAMTVGRQTDGVRP